MFIAENPTSLCHEDLSESMCTPDLSRHCSPVHYYTAGRACPDPHTEAALQEGAVGGCTGGVGWREGVVEEVGSRC